MAPPGLGKTTYVESHPELSLEDADAILWNIFDASSGYPEISPENLQYFEKCGWGFAKWHRVNFR